jgi:predicted metal-binding membrane protein
LDKIQKAIFVSIVFTSVVAWLFSIEQPDMMEAMMTLNPMAVAIFVSSWTIGMAAMMFPAIVPMVLLYNRMISNSHNGNNDAYGADSVFGCPKQNVSNSEQDKNGWFSLVFQHSLLPVKTYAFVGTYLLVWALTGVLLLVFWSVLVNGPFASYSLSDFAIASGVLLVIAGIYQFSQLKKKCLGYCESPIAFFMRRWKGNNLTAGLKMGLYHGVYCLGCCWPYFLLMIALGWMKILCMG